MSHRRAFRTAVLTSLVVHGVALATWSTQRLGAPVRLGGHSKAIHLTVSPRDPQWSPEIAVAESTTAEAPVLIRPTEARIAKRRYLHTPATQLPATDPIGDVTFDVTPVMRPRERVDDLPPTWLGETIPATSRRDLRVVMGASPSRARVEPPASLGGTEDTPPDLSRNAPPSYPAIAIQRRWQGTVLLRVWIDEAGRVANVAIERTSGHSLLDSAAATAVRQWHAVPATRNGQPVATVELLPVQFRL